LETKLPPISVNDLQWPYAVLETKLPPISVNARTCTRQEMMHAQEAHVEVKHGVMKPGFP